MFFWILEYTPHSSLLHLFPSPGISSFFKQLRLPLFENGGIRTQDPSVGCAYCGWVLQGTCYFLFCFVLFYHADLQMQNETRLSGMSNPGRGDVVIIGV